MKVEESLNVTFDESPPPTKLSPLVDDDVGEEEAIKKNTKVVNNNNNEEDESIEVDEIINIKESKNHPLDQVIGNLNQRTLRSQAQNHSNFFCFISTIEPKDVKEALKDESWVVAMQEELNQFCVDPRLEAIVERMLDKCISDGEFQQAIGISIECRRLDKLKEAIISSDNVHATLAYCMIISHAFINRREYRSEVLLLLVKVYQDLASPDYLNICQRLMFLDLPEGVANILEKLLRSENKDDAMMAFQIAFDLIENEHQAFLLSVRDRLSSPKLKPEQPKATETDIAQSGNASVSEDTQMTEETEGPVAVVPESDLAEVTYAERLTKMKGILSGETSIQLTLQFLYSHNKSDLLILKTIKQSIEMRNSVCHCATIYANALMHAGTTVDTFLRENLDWLSRATNWAKFSATAGLGVSHRGHLQQGRSLMAPYLPQSGSGSGGSPYSEGGALYALGLIHANHGEGIKQFLKDSLRSTNVEIVQHGACLGLGLAAQGTADEDIYDDIKSVLYTDSAVLKVNVYSLIITDNNYPIYRIQEIILE
ncbi:26S proteasome non-ATPase regulatory subunit 1 homolog A-like protein [Tanacetum coccineum]